jgi:3-hydroxyisobutyrate dehydrogenase-like beta-hydroxyacid dehydrogenase
VQNDDWPSTVGVIGLGIIGSAIARNLAAAGRKVIGFDTDPARRPLVADAGAWTLDSAVAAAAQSDLLLTSLPTEQALAETVDALVQSSWPRGQILAELSTLSLQGKTHQSSRLAAAGVGMLDCPISGTGAQAAAKDIVLLVSGDEAAARRCQRVFGNFSRSAIYLGAFGAGTKMKLVANLLVAIHNVAAAEAISLGIRCGLDPASLCETLCAGAGNSRMLELRGPMMVRSVYEPPTMKLDVWQKDMGLIAEFARDVGAATPLFDATAPLYRAAIAAGRGHQDTTAVRSALEALAQGAISAATDPLPKS